MSNLDSVAKAVRECVDAELARAKVGPKPGQVWGWADGYRVGPYVLIAPRHYDGVEGAWDVWSLSERRCSIACWFGVPNVEFSGAKVYLREATPAERKAAGLPEEPSAARVAELEAEVAALTAWRDVARNDHRIAGEANCRLLVERDNAIARADKSERAHEDACDRATRHAATAEARAAEVRRLNAWVGELEKRLSAPPAPGLDAAEVAFVRALARANAGRTGWMDVDAAAKRAAKGV